MLHADSLDADSLDADYRLPIIIDAAQFGQDVTLLDVFSQLEPLVEQYLPVVGGVLFRGFNVADVNAFRQFATAFGQPLLNYEFGSTPRSEVGGQGVYSSTEYPADQSIPLHNEQAYTTQWPMKIWFHCVEPAQSGGETPIADSRLIFNAIDPVLRERFTQRKLMYVRNYGNGLDISWEKVFNTDSRAVVETFCRENQIQYEWKPDGELRTRQVCQAVACHPHTHEMVWFNQAHLFHVSNLQDDVREVLLEVVAMEDLPRNVYYGDGEPIEDSILDEIRAAIDSVKIVFPWMKRDVLMLDNMLVAHAREPFVGSGRKVVVAMA